MQEEPKPKRARIEQISPNEQREVVSVTSSSSQSKGVVPGRIESGIFSKIPPELFRHILKFLSSEVLRTGLFPSILNASSPFLLFIYLCLLEQDLISCSLVCRFLNSAASDESLWRRL